MLLERLCEAFQLLRISVVNRFIKQSFKRRVEGVNGYYLPLHISHSLDPLLVDHRFRKHQADRVPVITESNNTQKIKIFNGKDSQRMSSSFSFGSR